MNKQAHYVYFDNPNKVQGPFATQQLAEEHAAGKGTVTRLTGNDILTYRIKVVAPRRA
jgi:hypothetical protein